MSNSRLTKIKIKGSNEEIPVTTNAQYVYYDSNSVKTVKDKIDESNQSIAQLESLPRIITKNNERILAFYPNN